MGRLTDRFFYVVALVAVAAVALMLIGAVFTLRNEIRENRKASYEIECILLISPDARGPKTISDCREEAETKV